MTEPSCRASTNSRSSGSPANSATSVEPGLANIVVRSRRRSTSKAASRTVRPVGSPIGTTLREIVWSFQGSGRVSHAKLPYGLPMPPVRNFRPAVSGASEQIALQIRQYLETQDLVPGDRIGTEAELAEEFGVSRPTL